MDKKNVLISTLRCIFALSFLIRYTHAACADDTNGMKKFGSDCNHMCHCKDAAEQCQDVDGTCTTSGCANTWMGPGCQYRDIAFGEYSRHQDNMWPTNFSYLANDGLLSTCSRTSLTSNKPWWRLWLPRKEVITRLVLITETDKINNFKKFKVTVEEVAIETTQTSNTRQQTCYTYSNMNPPSKTIEVTCDQPLFDNQVRIKLDGTRTQLVLCDIRIYGGKNLAFGKQTSQSSYGPNSISARTVDGIIGNSSDKCSSTHSEDNPWWSTDLGYIMRIQAVRLSTYTDEGLLNFKLQVKNDSNDTWKTIYDDNGKDTPTKNVTIFEEARYLRLFIPRNSVQLILCEVQIFGECTAGRWGPGCDFPCNCLNADVCSVQTGHCPKGCKDGFKATPTCQAECDYGTFGSNCTSTCGQCKNGDICHKVNGSCLNGCARGWLGNICKDKCTSGTYGDECSLKCSDHCKGGHSNCNNVNGRCAMQCNAGWMGRLCNQECTDGSYGENCGQQCGHCLNAPCDKISGNCIDGCKIGYQNAKCDIECYDGYYGIGCKNMCSNNCKDNQSCGKTDGVCECKAGWKGDICDQECHNGTYGEKCLEECGHCLTGPCDSISGKCTGGCMAGYKEVKCDTECNDGYYGISCKNMCSNNCKDNQSCDKTDGVCECKAGWKGDICDKECHNGTYGEKCLGECGHCLTGPCDSISGKCTGGCMAGYKEIKCDTECDDGLFGTNCANNCSDNCQERLICNKVNGFCKCKAGWKGDICEQECDDGTHSINCTGTCGSCSGGVINCNKTTGACALGCAEGFGGNVCTAELPETQPTPVAAIVGGIVAAVVVIVAVLAVLLFLRHRRRKIEKQNKFVSNSENLTDVCRDDTDNKHDTKKSVRDKPPQKDNIYMNSSVLSSLHDAGDGDTKTTPINSTLKSKPPTGANENDCEYYNTSVQRDIPKTAIWLSNLREYIGSKASSNDIFHQQFITLPKGLVHPTTVALKPKNRPKNRYKEMYTYDHSRVVLNTLPGQPDSDYINAAFINGQSLDKAYIAAQGPTKVNTVDFWRMIWEMNVTKVVMVTNVKEEGKDKCQQYWDSKEPSSYGSLLITVASEEVMAEFTIRTFIVKSISQNKQRTITHYQFTAWPDKSTPKGLTGLVQFWSKVRKDDTDSTHPWLVHCSAGVGRTGTFIALDILYDQGEQLEYVDVYQCVRELRQQRVSMVQTQEQYRYLHEVVYEVLILPSQAIPWCDFENEYRELLQVEKNTGVTLLNTQFEIQEDFVHLPKEDIADKEQSDEVTDVYAVAKLPENKNKNRYNNILASKDYRTFLSTHVPGCNNYINAVYIPSYRQLRGFILTQAPLEHTAIDCCRLFYDMDIDVVVAFDDTGTEEVGMYLPDQGSVEIGPFHVELMSEDKKHYYTTKNYNMHYKEKVKRIKQILFTKWSRDETIPRDPEAILSLLHEVTEEQRQSNDSPILVQCLNGAERSGMFVVLMNVLERMRIEQEVAIPPVIRNLRQIRQQIIPNFEQYKFCHEIVLRHIQDNSTYANV